MEIYSTEEQQVDAIKQFWKDYGTTIVIGAVVGLGGLFGWNSYSEHKVAQAESASAAFQTLSAAGETDTKLLAAAKNFEQTHSAAGYQALVELMVAKAAVEQGDYAAASSALNKVIASKVDQSLVALANIRLARIQAEQTEYTAALATLEQVTEPAFLAQRDELKGDYLLQQGEQAQARAAYQAALDAGGAATSPALQMKLDNLNKA